MIYGVTPAGFVKKPVEVISAEIDAELKRILGDSAGTEPDGSIPPSGAAGQLKTMIVDREAAHWDLQQAVYASFDPRQNIDEAQDAVGMITGVTRLRAKSSTVVATCTGDPGTVLVTGRVAKVKVAGSRFDTDSQVTIAALTAWAALTTYAVGDRRTNANRAYICITGGLSAGSGGPTTTAADITDGTVHWRYMGEGTGAVDVPTTAEQTGAIGAVSGTLTEIATPVAGWRSVINLLDATLGQSRESNAQFRVRRDLELQSTGNAATDAIRARVLRVGENTNNPVLQVRVFHNDTDLTDPDGLLAHSVEVLVRGGDDTEIAKAIFGSVSSGTRTLGTTLVVIQDSLGNDQSIRFTRPTLEPIYIVANVSYFPPEFPDDLVAGALQIAEQIVFLGDAFPIGRSVRSQPLAAEVTDGHIDEFTPTIRGVLEVTSLYIGLAPAPGTSTTIPIGARELATFDTSRITVNLTPGTP